ncbi:SMP-30/gluconolactonase/LRE family protein [Streptomyces flavofungini]|uniref:Superoxide dismutase n=1 Tax=Streptomyces flavofungini TaxID=68200 RepID=A0ABS0XA57_9ACTN|nr:superoxide dismutase [Streptomyces flavofungini]MBJ3810024.1 superoxide dismutase [Streptomyces flavofungini]
MADHDTSRASASRRTMLGAGAALGALTALGPLATAARAEPAGASWPTDFSLPNGFQPEGIAIGPGPTAWFGSRNSGALYRASLATGRGETFATDMDPMSLGLRTDGRGRLFIAGGFTRQLRVFDTRTDRVLATYEVGKPSTVVNDVVLTPRAAWFTDSTQQQLYGLPFGPHGELPPARDIVTLPLVGEWVQAPADGFTTNGLERTPDGRGLLVINVHAHGGSLYRVDPRTGDTRRVDLGGSKLPDGDGALLLGRALYVVQQVQNAVDVFHLDATGLRGTAIARITDPRFRIPTTVAPFGNRLYLPNSRFTEETTPSTPYNAVAVRQVH